MDADLELNENLEITAALSSAVKQHQLGNYQEAAALYRDILSGEPHNPDANHNLAICLIQIESAENLATYFETAIIGMPKSEQFWLSYLKYLSILKQNSLLTFLGAVCDTIVRDNTCIREFLSSVGTNGISNISLRTDLDFRTELRDITVRVTNDDLKGAIEKTKRLLIFFPENIDLYNILGVSYSKSGFYKSAHFYYLCALRLNQQQPEVVNNIGNNYFKEGEYELAIPFFSKAIELKPDYTEASNNLALAYHSIKEFGKATDALQAALKYARRSINTLYNLGYVSHSNGNLKSAIDFYARVLELEPNHSGSLNNLATVHSNLGNYEQAERFLRKLCDIKPDSALAFYNLGKVYNSLGENSKAITAFRTALKLSPEYLEARNDLGLCELQSFNYSAAKRHFQAIIEADPGMIQAANNLGTLYHSIGEHTKALHCYESILQHEPSVAFFYINYAAVLKDLGLIDRAVSAYHKAISLDGFSGEPYRQLANLSRVKPEGKLFNTMEKLLDRENVTLHSKSQIAFGLASILDKNQEYNHAYKYYLAANSLRLAYQPYDEVRTLQQFDDVSSLAKQLRVLERVKASQDGLIPIFIVGMPRSGTTLLEQIISSHSMVEGKGELEFCLKHGTKLLSEDVAMSPEILSDFCTKYLRDVQDIGCKTRYFTDKMPMNFMAIPLLFASLPNFKILHITRDPRATCWSIFKTFFSSSGMGFAYNLQSLTNYYRSYEKFMAEMAGEYKANIISVSYEALTEEPSKEIPRIIREIGLPWERACLKPEANANSVRTASQQQVRKKIYSGSSDAWRRYEQFLPPSFISLK